MQALRTFSFILLLVSAFCGSMAQAQPKAMIEPQAQAMPLLPFLDYLIDQSMAMDIEEVAGLSQGWQPFAAEKLPREEGIFWLRFKIAPLAPDARPRTFLLDMGESVPGVPILFDPARNELSGAMEWRDNLPAHGNILLLPEAGPEAITCYIRMEGLPGPWFAPMIRTPQNAAGRWGGLSRAGAILALAVTMLLCLMRAIGENGQWRYWTALFVGVALAQAVLGMPRELQHFSVANLAAILTPGLALMFLPHVGRHLMDARHYSRAIDIQLFLLSLPGAALAVLPLLPGFNWLDRWLDVWPIGAILFVPTALGAWMMAIPGGRRFLLACLLPPVFVAISLIGMDFGLPANILAACPLWGVAFCALLLVAMRAPVQEKKPGGDNAKKQAQNGAKREKSGLEMPSLNIEPETPIINLDRPLDDPNLRLIPSVPEEEAAPMPKAAGIRDAACPAPIKPVDAREMALREPVDEIMRETAALRQCALPPSAREAVASLSSAAGRLATLLSGGEIEDGSQPRMHTEEVFNLQRILRGAHDSVAAIAECSGIALSWYMPPHLAQTYRGDAKGLETTLRLLLENSVRCSSHGAIKLNVRAVPGSTEPGHLLFTVSDDGHGYPPRDRSSLALARAWELTGEYDGFLSVESASNGASISFTAKFRPMEGVDSDMAQETCVILACTDPGDRRHLARIIEAIPCRVIEATSPAETLTAQTQTPSSLLITQGPMARPSSADMAREFCRAARRAGLENCHILAITTDESQWPLLKSSGFTHAMLEPVDPEVLRKTVSRLLGIGSDSPDLPRHDGAALDHGAKAETQAPTMLVDQDFSIGQAFEGPDWLGQDEDDAPAITSQPPAAEPGAVKGMPQAKTVAIGDEWVGEPVPIQKPAGRSHKASETGTPEATAAINTDEWDEKSAPEQKPLTDFILSAEEKEKPASDVVDEFMRGSANMVGEAVTGALNAARTENNTSQNAAPEQMAMMRELDGQMRKASMFLDAGNTRGVAETTSNMARDAELFGMRRLARIAKCVERAAVKRDMDALRELLPELEHAVEINRISVGLNENITNEHKP